MLLDLFTSPWFSCAFLGLLVPWHPPLSLPGFFPTISISLSILSLSHSADPNSSFYCWNLAFCFDWSDKCCDYCVLTCLLIIIELLVFLDLGRIACWFCQTFDAVDGKQARRTNSSSPLGELFDHGNSLISSCIWLCMGLQSGFHLQSRAVVGVLSCCEIF